jgi:hypothetical protein
MVVMAEEQAVETMAVAVAVAIMAALEVEIQA